MEEDSQGGKLVPKPMEVISIALWNDEDHDMK